MKPFSTSSPNQLLEEGGLEAEGVPEPPILGP